MSPKTIALALVACGGLFSTAHANSYAHFEVLHPPMAPGQVGSPLFRATTVSSNGTKTVSQSLPGGSVHTMQTYANGNRAVYNNGQVLHRQAERTIGSYDPSTGRGYTQTFHVVNGVRTSSGVTVNTRAGLDKVHAEMSRWMTPAQRAAMGF